MPLHTMVSSWRVRTKREGSGALPTAKVFYLHGDANRRKIGRCNRFVQLVPNGIYFAARWEVRTDRKGACQKCEAR